MTRKLATVRVVKDIQPIPGADAIERITVDGWNVVAQKNLYQIGDQVIYFEVDSFLPIRPEFEFLRKSSYKSDPILGEGFRIKTIKLRGQISQGLLAPMDSYFIWNNKDKMWQYPDPGEKELEQIGPPVTEIEGGISIELGYEYYLAETGDDLTEDLGVKLYEKTITAENAKGNFPSFLKKTDQERWQNLTDKLDSWKDMSFEVSEKLDGSSITIYHLNGEIGVCSRNLEVTEESKFYHHAKALGIIEKLKNYGENIAVQGEMIGPGIQGNRYKLATTEIYVFDIWNIDQYRYMNDMEKTIIIDTLNLKQTPTIRIAKLNETGYTDFNFKSKVNPETIPEGMVLKSFDRTVSFKSINPEFLLKED